MYAVFGFLSAENWNNRLSLNVGKKINTTHCIITQKNPVLTIEEKLMLNKQT
jgi:hypothetical protein